MTELGYPKQDASAPSSQDYIRVNDLALTVSFHDGSRWPSSTPHAQPVLITFSFAHDVRNAAATDDLAHSVNYSTLASGMKAIVESEVFPSVEAFADRVYQVYASQYPGISSFTARIARTKALLYGETFGIQITKLGSEALPSKETYFLQNIVGHALIGIHPHERKRKQRVRVNVSITRKLSRQLPFDFRTLEQRVFDYVEDSKYLTVEALASSVAGVVLTFLEDGSAQVTVRISKPSAILGAESAEVEVMRMLEDFRAAPSQLSASSAISHTLQVTQDSSDNTPPQSLISAPELPDSQGGFPPHRAAIAIGANMGDRFANIECALRLLETWAPDIEQRTSAHRVVVVDTSFMYETAPMYVVDQPQFINCTCMIETDLEPRDLLSFLKQIEGAVGRTVTFRNGPRAIDLDIVTYDSIVMDTRPESARANLDNLSGELVIPHPRVEEREFVLRPLADMIPDYVIPSTGKTVESLLSALAEQSSDVPAMYKVIPFPHYPLPSSGQQSSQVWKHPRVPPTATYWTYPVTSHRSHGKQPPHKTYIMATLNATPDSFSDGSVNYTLPDSLSYATSAVASGAHIIDIGGYSTRPGAAFVTPEEEFTRVVPVVQAIREGGRLQTPTGSERPSLLARTAKTLISVDTFRWEVADEAVHAGANCINDVCALAGPDWPATAEGSKAHFTKMRQVVRDLAVPVVLMHSRGPAVENKDYSAYAYAEDVDGRGAVLEGVRVELGERVERAIKGPGGIRRWLVMVDPGIGFSKNVEGNIEILRDAASVVSEYSTRLQNLNAKAPESRPRRNPLAGYPLLIGASRKSFLGAVLQRAEAGAKVGTGEGYEGRETRPDERDWATAAAVSCAVQQGARIVRVHDVAHLADVVRVSSTLWS